MRFRLVSTVGVSARACVQAADRSVTGEPSGDKGLGYSDLITHAFQELRATLAVFRTLPGWG